MIKMATATRLEQNGDIYKYEYGERNRLNRVFAQKQGSSSQELYLEYTYDAIGNTIERIAYTKTGVITTSFEYDTLNRVVRSIEGTKVTEYLYDNAGNRFIKKGPEGTTFYLRHGQISVAMDIEIPLEQTEYAGKINRYVMSGDLLAGRITRTILAGNEDEISVYYYHLDHLNSTKVVSDENGEVDVGYVYRAFGEQLAKIGEGDAKYTYGGKELDDETNLYYFNARYYDAVIGRFISEDPVRDGTNWYVYVDNNPLRLVDPTGLSSFSLEIYRYEFQYTIKELDLPNTTAYTVGRLFGFASGLYQGEGSQAFGLIAGFMSVGGLRDEVKDLAERRESGGTFNILNAWSPGTGDVLRTTHTVTANYSCIFAQKEESFTYRIDATITLANGESYSGPVGQSTYTRQTKLTASGIYEEVYANERGNYYFSSEHFVDVLKVNEPINNELKGD